MFGDRWVHAHLSPILLEAVMSEEELNTEQEELRISTKDIEVVFRAMSQLTIGDVSTQWIVLHPLAIKIIKAWSKKRRLGIK